MLIGRFTDVRPLHRAWHAGCRCSAAGRRQLLGERPASRLRAEGATTHCAEHIMAQLCCSLTVMMAVVHRGSTTTMYTACTSRIHRDVRSASRYYTSCASPTTRMLFYAHVIHPLLCIVTEITAVVVGQLPTDKSSSTHLYNGVNLCIYRHI